MARKIPKGYKKGGVTSAKAKEILKHGKIKGKLLTDQQKKYFGWIAEGKKLENGGTSWYTPRELDISSMTSAGIGTLSSTGSGTNTDTPKDTGFSDVAGAGLGLTSAFFDVKYGKEEAERQRLIDEATSKVDTTGFQGALDREKALQESKDKNKRNYVEETALSTSLKMGAAGSSLGPLGTLGGLAAGAIAGTFLGKSIEKGAEATEAERRKKVGEGFVGIQEEKIATIDPTSRKEMDSTIPTVNVKKGGKVIKIGGKPLRKQTGGEIAGPGTGTSDDVPATLAQGSFIVPAKNNKKAEALRRTLLGQSPKNAKLKKGGVPVKVSNGEHLFTAKEINTMVKRGGGKVIDYLNSLAPEAEIPLKKGGKAIPMQTGGTGGATDWNRLTAAEHKKFTGTAYGRYTDGTYWTGNYVDGKKDGIRKRFYKNSKPMIEENWKNGKAISRKTWNREGKIGENWNIYQERTGKAKKYREKLKSIKKEEVKIDRKEKGPIHHLGVTSEQRLKEIPVLDKEIKDIGIKIAKINAAPDYSEEAIKAKGTPESLISNLKMELSKVKSKRQRYISDEKEHQNLVSLNEQSKRIPGEIKTKKDELAKVKENIKNESDVKKIAALGERAKVLKKDILSLNGLLNDSKEDPYGFTGANDGKEIKLEVDRIVGIKPSASEQAGTTEDKTAKSRGRGYINDAGLYVSYSSKKPPIAITGKPTGIGTKPLTEMEKEAASIPEPMTPLTIEEGLGGSLEGPTDIPKEQEEIAEDLYKNFQKRQEEKEAVTPTEPDPEGFDFNFSDLLALGQAGMGLKGLAVSRDRPTGEPSAKLRAYGEEIDALQPSFEFPIAEAMKQIEKERTASSIALSGDRASERARKTVGMRQAMEAKAGLLERKALAEGQAEDRFALAKVGMKGQLASLQAGEERNLFLDDLGAFKDKQMAYGNLLQAGISNFVQGREARRTRQELLALDKPFNITFQT